MKTRLQTRSSIIMAFMAVALLFMASCKKDDIEPIVYGDARIKVVNAVPGSASQDFYQNETMLSGGTVAYGQASAYLTVKAGPSAFYFKNTGSTTVSASFQPTTETGGSYTLFYLSNGTSGGVVAGIADDNTVVANKARVRFVNLSQVFNNSVNVSIASGTNLAAGLAANQVSTYSSIDSNTDINVTVIGSTPVTISGSNFVAGKNYTVWLDAVNTTTANYHVILQN